MSRKKNRTIVNATNGAGSYPMALPQTHRQLIIDRFFYCMKLQFPKGVGPDQFRDVVRTWFMGWHQNLMHINEVYGMRQQINDEIHFFTLNFAECMSVTWDPTIEFCWWK